jgi:ATP-dependent Clp protease, protease subunit
MNAKLLSLARAAGVMVLNVAAPAASGVPRLLQLVRNNAERTRDIRAEEADDVAHVYVYGVIGGWFGDVTAQAFATVLSSIKASTVHLHINSPGGDVFEARAMMSAIANHPATFVAHVDGLAASAATMLVMACDESEISQGGFFMIHNAWTVAIGNKTDLRTTADLLEKVDDTIVDDYRRKTKKSEAQIREWMDQETWFSAEEAQANGFVDRVVEVVPEGEDAEAEPAEPENRAAWDLSAYEHAPAAALKVSPEKASAPAAAIAAHRASLARRLRLLERTAA